MMPEIRTDYSAGFAAILDERAALIWKMNACFILAAAVLVVPAYRSRRLSIALTLPVIGAIVSGIAAGALFTGWWNRAEQAAVNEADRQWIADHDGGGLIVGVGILLKALLCFRAISIPILIASIRRAKSMRTALHRLDEYSTKQLDAG